MPALRPATKRTNAHAATPAAPAIVPAIYTRVSTEEQAKEGYGLDVQLRRATAQAIVKGWPDVAPEHIYSDEGLSGTLIAAERPGLARLLADVRAGAVSAVIILALDRLGRKTRIILDVVEEITEAGAELISCKESLDTTTPAGRFVLTIFAALAQLERDNIVERTTGGRDARGLKDGEKGGRLPFGYLRTPDGIEIDRVAAAVVKTIHKERHRRKQSLQKIADLLNASNTPAPSGGLWHATSVRVVLENEAAYRGGRRGDSEACWPKILT